MGGLVGRREWERVKEGQWGGVYWHAHDALSVCQIVKENDVKSNDWITQFK